MGLNKDMNSFAERVRSRRIALGLTQSQLAKLAGLRQPDISKIELGKINETTKLLGLARALKCTPDWLETGKGQIERPEQIGSGYETSHMQVFTEEPANYLSSHQPEKLRMALGIIQSALSSMDMNGRQKIAPLFESFARSPGSIIKEDIAVMLGKLMDSSCFPEEESNLQKTG